MRKTVKTTYKDFNVIQMSDGRWLAEVNITTDKTFKLQYSHEEEKVAKEAIWNYLISQNAEEDKSQLALPGHGDS